MDKLIHLQRFCKGNTNSTILYHLQSKINTKLDTN